MFDTLEYLNMKKKSGSDQVTDSLNTLNREELLRLLSELTKNEIKVDREKIRALQNELEKDDFNLDY